jgi:hypothetical protein
MDECLNITMVPFQAGAGLNMFLKQGSKFRKFRTLVINISFDKVEAFICLQR